MAWSTAVADLRTLLSDQGNDRYCYRKKVFGNINGTNLSFKTFEFRRVTDFTESDSPLGIFANGVAIDPTKISDDDLLTGEFTFQNGQAPAEGTAITATYYYQWFEDSELQDFLTQATRWLQLGTDYTQIPDGLNQGALYYAASMAMEKMSIRWATRSSNSFLLEDAPKKEAMEISATYSKQADAFAKKGTGYRDDYYTKSGQSLAAFSRSNWGQISSVTPRR